MNEIGNNLKRIRLLKKLSLKKAGDLLKMSAPAILKYENGKIIPNSEKLILFANAYNVKVLDLLSPQKSVEMKFNSFRKKQRLKGQNLDLLKEIITNKVANYLEVLELNEEKYSSIKLQNYTCNSYEDAENASFLFRKNYYLSINQPISDLISILENIGIVIIQIENTNGCFSDFDGLSEIVNNIPVIVMLNDTDGARQRFTLAHELGHLLLDIKNKELDEEKLCNIFAGSLLMPKNALIYEFGPVRSNISFYEFVAFKKEYKVSFAATLYRLKQLKIISDYLYKKINISFSSKGFKKKEPINITPEESYKLKKIVHKLEVDKIISLNKACELLGISEDEFDSEDNNYRY